MQSPDEHGRYRVRRRGDTGSPVWSTRNYNPDKHVIVPGPASDTYGAAFPPEPSPAAVADLSEDGDLPNPDNNPDEEN